LAVNSFESSNTLSQSTIDGYKADISSARTSISDMTSSLIDAREDYRASLSSVSVQEAKVRSAEAEVKRIDAEIGDTVIRAPFSGIITLQDGKVGKSVSANEKVVGLISETFEIETFVPEVLIPGIAIGNSASVTFDAYDDEVFEATVSHVDPGETEKDGVSSYKVKLVFTTKDARIRPGLTANVVIVTELRPDTLSIPERAVLKEDGKSYVFVKTGKEVEKREIVTGERDGMGNVEVLQHLNVSEVIALDPAL
jgi:RND family efflux transporter MFP subunit